MTTDEILVREKGIEIKRRYPKALAKAVQKVYATQVAHKDFRKILREMEE